MTHPSPASAEAEHATPLSQYALLGDTRTAALVSAEGSIDWLCLPRFDSEPLFGRLLDPRRGGRFLLGVEGAGRTERRYRPASAVLETSWTTAAGTATLTEGLVLQVTGALRPQLVLVRRLECRSGEVDATLLYDPRPGLPGRTVRSERRHGHLVSGWGRMVLALRTSPDLAPEPGRLVRRRLTAGESVVAVLTMAEAEPLVYVPPGATYDALEACDRWWRTWCAGCEFEGPYRHALERSLITLRLLTYSPTGAPVAAPTTSLPEEAGGVRNWDYRFAWPRDASVGISAFLGVGKHEEARSFLEWLGIASRLTRPRLRVLYTLHGRSGVRETEVDVQGYAASRPVRVGNQAQDQHQLDVYGWVVDAAWSLVQAGQGLAGDEWRLIASLADFVADHWREPDAGIWEVRDRPAHHVHSKVWGWMALDRALKLADGRRIGSGRLARWRTARQDVLDEVRRRGWSEAKRSYVRSYGEEELDAVLLLLPLTGFEPAGSERLRSTVDAIRGNLGAGGPWMYRYRPATDGLPGREGAFVPCSFYLLEALVRTGRVTEAVDLFEKLLSRIGDLCLLPEEIDPGTGEFLGNYPLCLSQAGLVHTILEIARAVRA